MLFSTTTISLVAALSSTLICSSFAQIPDNITTTAEFCAVSHPIHDLPSLDLALTEAQFIEASEPAFNYNSSGHVNSTGLKLSTDSTTPVWNFGRYVEYSNEAGNVNITTQYTFDSPSQNISNEALMGCFYAPDMVPTTKAFPFDGTATCTSALGASCLAVIKSKMSSVVLSGDSSDTCDNFFDALDAAGSDSACAGLWNGLGGSNFLPNELACPLAGETSPGVAVYGTTEFYTGVSATNFTLYDAAMELPQPLFVAAWDAAGSATFSDVVCVQAGSAQAGSRKVSASPTTTGTTTSAPTTGVSATASPTTTHKASAGSKLEIHSGVMAAFLVAAGLTWTV